MAFSDLEMYLLYIENEVVPMTDSVDVWQKLTQYCKAIILQLKVLKTHK